MLVILGISQEPFAPIVSLVIFVQFLPFWLKYVFQNLFYQKISGFNTYFLTQNFWSSSFEPDFFYPMFLTKILFVMIFCQNLCCHIPCCYIPCLFLSLNSGGLDEMTTGLAIIILTLGWPFWKIQREILRFSILTF